MDGAKAAAMQIRLRLVLPTILLMLLSSLDRVNISFAALQMNRELGFSPSEYGFGAGILFVGFLAGQYPSILLLQRIGFRRWISLSAIVWGCCAGALGLIHGIPEFYVLRILLGLAEGGLAPGIVLYLSQFATERERATTFALPMVAIPLSIVIGGPLSGWLMQASPFGLSGWRWMFFAEAAPTILFGLIALVAFPDTPDEARWLSEADRLRLARGATNRPSRTKNDWRVLQDPLIWACAILWFCLLSGSYGIMFWLPQMVQQLTGLPPLVIGLINALPWIGAALGTWLNSQHSDRSGERFWHIALPATIAAAALVVAAGAGAGAFGLAALFVVGLALGSAQGAFWALPTSIFTPATFAVGAVAINMCGSAGGLVMPHVIGIAREASGDFHGPTILLAGILLLAAMIVVAVRVGPRGGRIAAA
jgi:MFS family permease